MLPPSAHLPQPVTNFSARRQGPEVRLAWTAPQTTTAGEKLAAPPAYALCVWPGRVLSAPAIAAGPGAASPRTPLAPPPSALAPVPEQVPSPPPPAEAARVPSGAVMPACPQLLPLTPQGAVAIQASVRLRAPAGARGGGFVTLALAARNRNGASAGWSNPAVVPLTPVAPPPRLLTATPTAEGVELRWAPASAPAGAVAIYRNGQRLASAPANASSYLDRSAQWGERYAYWLVATAGTGAAAVSSAPSNRLQVTPVDHFPPPSPTGLEAVHTPAGVALSWNAGTAADLAGYNVYRAPAGTESWHKLNPAPVATPVYQDPQAPGGARYRVTAVDRFGNESPPSPPVTPR
ncbi:MAG: fibronectin type III domain-containing protein [Terriglobales bacterium]